MAAKKDKLIEGAQKFIAKGQIDRAIREYEQIVALDPEDIRQRQKLAELLVRVNQKEAAISEYETISKQYSNKHFYLKAIAVHKQIQKLDPDNIHVTLALAGLNVKQGLIGNALAEYGQAVNYFIKSDSLQEAIVVIEQMLAADPENLNTRLKYAETYYTAGERDRSSDEFAQLALFLLKRGDESAFGRVCDRVRSLFPDRPDFAIDILAKQLQEGNAGVVVSSLQKFVDAGQVNLKGWKLLADAHLKNGDAANSRATLEKIVSLFPDELSAREDLIRLLLEEGDVDGSMALLEAHEAEFLDRNSHDALERLYSFLREKASGNKRVMEWLKRVYETAWDAEKPDAVATFTEEEKEELPQPEAEVSPSPLPPPPTQPEAEPLTAGPAEEAREMSWEEEIDLSLLEEEGISSFPDGETDLGGAPAASFATQPQEEAASMEASAACPDGEAAAGNVPEPFEWEEAPLQPEAAGHGEEPAEDPLGLTEIEMELEDASLDFAGLPPEPPMGESAVEAPASPSPADRKDGQFRVDDQLDKDDTETHYNLGIAYKEMCLFDEAVNEFRTASMDPQRKIDCLTLQGICYRDKGDYAKAEELFSTTLALPGLTEEERVSLGYELAFLYETTGRKGDALGTYLKVRAENPGFRDVVEKISLLGGADQEEMELLELDTEEGD
ncbi:MAG TPA: tetratricopeptide repeat protein [Geobacteraceae bacterium]